MKKGFIQDYNSQVIEDFLLQVEPLVESESSEPVTIEPVEPSDADRWLVRNGLSRAGALIESRLDIKTDIFTTDWIDEGEKKISPLVSKYGIGSDLMPEWMMNIVQKWEAELQATLFIGATVWQIKQALNAKEQLKQTEERDKVHED